MDHFSAVSLVAKAIAEQQYINDSNSTGTSSGNSSLGLNLQLCQVPVNISSSHCVTINNYTLASSLSTFLFSLIAVIGFQFLQKRVKPYPTCCFGRPGLQIPVDLIRHSKYRLIYVAIFGSMSFLFYDVVSGKVSPPINPQSNSYSQEILSIFGTLLTVSVICIWYYPLFASVDTPVPIIGHSVGFIFVIFNLINKSLREYGTYSGCENGCKRENLQIAVEILSEAPVFLLEIFLLLWFFGSIIHDIFTMRSNEPPDEYAYLQDHMKRVKQLLKTAKMKEKELEFSKMKTKKILHFIYPYDPGFKFPLRFLAGMAVTLCVIYQLALLTTYYNIVLTIGLVRLIKQVELLLFNKILPEADIGIENEELIFKVVKMMGNAAIIIGVLLATVIILVTIFSLVQIFLTFRNVSIHFHLSTKGDTSFLPNHRFPTLQKSLTASFKYPGYLIAYSVWAWFVYTGMLLLIMIILAVSGGIMVLIGFNLGPRIIAVLIGIIWAQLIYWSEFLFIKHVFLKKAYPDSEHLIFNNRRLIHWFTYFFLFQNAFVGLFSTCIRILMSLVFGVLAFARLDKVLLIRGYESFDDAYETYVGMLYLDHIQNNSVMNVFCHILLKQIKLKEQLVLEKITDVEVSCDDCDESDQHKQRGSWVQAKMIISGADRKYMKYEEMDEVHDEAMSQMISHRTPSTRPHVSQRAYNRWRVAYTLIRNESLIELTASSINQQKRFKVFREHGMHH